MFMISLKFHLVAFKEQVCPMEVVQNPNYTIALVELEQIPKMFNKRTVPESVFWNSNGSSHSK